jgi:superfamily II DNA or RNA helicase
MSVSFLDFHNSLDPDPAKRGKQFEHFVKWFLKNDPAWAAQVADVWLWNEWPERWGADCGIDLVLRHKNGEHWAVQAKCYSPDHDITKHDVDKFLSESNRPLIQGRLLLATTDRIGANAKQVCDAQEKPVIRFLRSDFDKSSLNYPADFSLLEQAKRKPCPVPRNHQTEAIVGVVQGLQSVDRGQLIMACGTGKTYVTLWIKEALGAQRTLVLVPSLGLLSQLLREWTFAAAIPFEPLCVCSDKTVGSKGNDESIHSVADLGSISVTSDAEEVKRFLSLPGNRVVISTYQSSLVIAAAQADPAVPAFDLAVADEAHRCAGKVGGDFTAILDDVQIRSAKRLFATATPRTYSSTVHKAAEARGVEVVGMDNATLFGTVLYALPFGKAIDRKLLTDYRVVIIGVDDATIAEWIDRRELVSTGTGIETDSESLAAQIGLLKAMKDYDLKRIISFHSRVNRAENFTTDLRKITEWISDDHRPSGALHADFVSGNMPAGKRMLKLDRLKKLNADERGVLSNARCLSEGVDVPSLDGVAFIDPRSSRVDIIQAVGRAIRLSPDKKIGTIILPVFLKAGKDAVNTIEVSNFKPIWEVLDALKAHDDELASDLDQIRTELGRKPGATISAAALGKIGISLPAAVDESFGVALRTYLVEQVSASWNFWFGLLEAYVQENGSAWVSAKYVTPDGYKLGAWVNGQRNSKLNSQLSQDRVARLESLPAWVWDAYREKWENGFAQLMAYVKVHGDAKVPMAQITSHGYKLGNWLTKVRSSKLKNQLSQDRIQRLEEVPGWSWSILDEKWDEGFRALEKYVAERGDSRVPPTYVTPHGYQLGAWLDRQRRLRLVQRLDQNRTQRLDGLPGWSWEIKRIAPRQNIDWTDAFGRLAEFANREGHVMVPRRHEMADGFRLGSWVNSQRQSESSLDTLRKRKLEALPGWTWAIDNSRDVLRERAIRELLEFVKREGHARVPTDYKTKDGFRLGGWVQKKRSQLDQLSLDYRRQLEVLPGWTWDVLSDRWEEGFRHLVQFAEREGHARVETAFIAEDGYRLGNWAQSQRNRRNRITAERKGKVEHLPDSHSIGPRDVTIGSELSQDRIDRLESIPGWGWSPNQERWQELWGIGFSELLEYVKTHGDAKVPLAHITPEGYRLGNWVATARGRKSKNLLSSERTARLEAVPGWSWGIRDEKWEEGFRMLEEYVAERGDTCIPPSYITPSGYQLGTWLDRQRRLWLGQTLDQDRTQRLGGLPGWSWERKEIATGKPSDWEDAFRRLVEYSGREGHSTVPRHYETPDGFHLGDWVKSQRKSRGRMPQHRKSRLEELPGWRWTSRISGEVLWEAAIRELRQFVERKGHAKVPKDYKTKDGFHLGGWVHKKRSQMDHLPLENKAQLEALPGWTWDALSDRWEDGFRHLAEFCSREGHAKVKQGFSSGDGYPLGAWVANQRARKRMLSAERKFRLESLPGWIWAVESLQWDDWIDLLMEFAQKNGHTRVPQAFKTSDGYLLGRWVNTKRTKRDGLTPDQQSELESLPGWVWRVT